MTRSLAGKAELARNVVILLLAFFAMQISPGFAQSIGSTLTLKGQEYPGIPAAVATKARQMVASHRSLFPRVNPCLPGETGLRILWSPFSFPESWMATANYSLNVLAANGCMRS